MVANFKDLILPVGDEAAAFAKVAAADQMGRELALLKVAGWLQTASKMRGKGVQFKEFQAAYMKVTGSGKGAEAVWKNAGKNLKPGGNQALKGKNIANAPASAPESATRRLNSARQAKDSADTANRANAIVESTMSGAKKTPKQQVSVKREFIRSGAGGKKGSGISGLGAKPGARQAPASAPASAPAPAPAPAGNSNYGGSKSKVERTLGDKITRGARHGAWVARDTYRKNKDLVHGAAGGLAVGAVGSALLGD